MGDLSGFEFCVGVFFPFPQAPAFLIQNEGTGEEDGSLYKTVFPFSATSLVHKKATRPSHSWPQQCSRGWTFPTA